MLEAIKEAIEATLEHKDLGLKHFGRPHGSALVINGGEDRSPEAAMDLFTEVFFVEVTDVLPQSVRSHDKEVRYFRFSLPEGYAALQQVISLGDMTDEELKTVKVRRAIHQDESGKNVEFFSNEIDSRVVTRGHLIIGPYKGETVVHTWYPGEVTAFIDTKFVTVKLRC